MTTEPEAFEGFVFEEPEGRMSLGELTGDLLPALRVAALVAVAGLVPGLLWALLAPGEKVVSLAGAVAPLTDETDHVFDATALFFLLVTAYGVIAGTLVWWWRARRGPVVMVTTAVAALLGGLLAAGVGTLLAPAGAPVPVLIDRAQASASGTPGPPVPATLLAQAATLGSWWTVGGAALGALLAYVIGAIAWGTEDIGRP